MVVTDKNGRPVPGLRKEDFQVFENGKPQVITFFEPGLAANGTATPPSTTRSNTFTNTPLVDSRNVTNVLLLDALDSWPEDQMYAQVQMIQYLASLPPHLRIGIFTLTPEKLNLIWPLNQDSSVLTLAIARFAFHHSSASSTRAAQQQALLSGLNKTAQEAQDSRVAESANALRKFLTYGSGVIQQHNNGGLEAVQALARYLAGIPGRKNLFWIIGNFPHCEPINSCSGTIDALEMAGVSVYPIDAHGVDVNLGLGPDPDFHQAERRFIDSEAWAEDTGGKAFHANNIEQEITAAVDHGSHFYTLAYVPRDRKQEGRERVVEVKVPSRNYSIFYRRHYLEPTQKRLSSSRAASASPLLPLMGHGLPNSDEIPYRLNILPSAAQPAVGAKRAGQNSKLAGKLNRYDMGFELQASGLSLPPDADGVRRKTLQVAIVVYGHDFKPLNWEIRTIRLLIKPDQWTEDQRYGIRFNIQIDAPAGDISLRTGVYDSSTARVGTLEVPLGEVTAAAH